MSGKSRSTRKPPLLNRSRSAWRLGVVSATLLAIIKRDAEVFFLAFESLMN